MRDATRSDLPKGREAACPICWRMFTSDSACEMHKPYRKPQGPVCKDPLDLAMVSHERRGLAIWGTQMSAEALERLKSVTVEG